MKDMQIKMREFCEHVKANSEHVGDKFPQEARAMPVSYTHLTLPTTPYV